MVEGKEMGKILARHWEGGRSAGGWGTVGACGRLKAAGVRVMTISQPVESYNRLNSAEDGISRKG